MSNNKDFSKLRAFFLPIHKNEFKKFIPMCFLMFLILFIYTLVRNLEDGFLQYNTHVARGSTTVLISALEFWYVLPGSFLAVMFFTLLNNKLGSKKAFYTIVSIFLFFFAVFGFFLYPHLDDLIISEDRVTAIIENTPAFFRTFLTCLLNWPITLFYVFTEIWGVMVISSLFWQFANAVTLLFEVKRFFGLFPIVGNIGTYCAAEAVERASKDLTVRNIRILMLLVVASGILVLATYTFINKKVLINTHHLDSTKVSNKKQKVNMFEGIKILFTNTYIRLISVLVIGYSMAINFSEVVLKEQMKMLCVTPEEYIKMHSMMLKSIGLLTIFTTIIVSNVLRKCKWKTAALVTPVIFLVTGFIFFGISIYNKFISSSFFGVSALSLAVFSGITQIAMAKSVKYSLFDTTKSMTYIPLDKNVKTQGQATVEVVESKAGEASASFLQQIMYGSVENPVVIDHLIPIVLIFFTAVIGWIFSIFCLNPRYEKAMEQYNKTKSNL